MLIKSYSKLNLSLKILKKQTNGLHDISSYNCLINLYDKIHIKKISDQRDKIIFKGPFKKNIKDKNNSVKETLNLLRKIGKIKNKYSIVVNKQIPVFSGLGGGTSNSAHLLKYFYRNKINYKIIDIFEKKIGTDLKLFLYKQSFLKNLKNIKKINFKYNLNFVLIYPYLKCSTKEIYSKFKKKKSRLSNVKNNNNLFQKIVNKNNDLESIVIQKYPIIKKILIYLNSQKGCHFSRITGSGSACFGVFKSRKLAKEAQKNMKIKFPSFFCALTKTI